MPQQVKPAYHTPRQGRPSSPGLCLAPGDTALAAASWGPEAEVTMPAGLVSLSAARGFSRRWLLSCHHHRPWSLWAAKPPVVFQLISARPKPPFFFHDLLKKISQCHLLCLPTETQSLVGHEALHRTGS